MSQIPRIVNLQSGESVPIDRILTFGRLETCEVRIPDKSISRNHATVEKKGDEYIFTDKGSSNGSEINGIAVQGSQALKPGDKIKIGEFVFEVHLPGDSLKEATTLLTFELQGRDLLSERLKPEELSTAMNSWHSLCIRFVKNHHGGIASVEGDRVLAYWESADVPHRLKALAAARTVLLSPQRLLEDLETFLRPHISLLQASAALHAGIAISKLDSSGLQVLTGIGVDEGYALLGRNRDLNRRLLASPEFLSSWPDAPESEGMSQDSLEIFSLREF